MKTNFPNFWNYIALPLFLLFIAITTLTVVFAQSKPPVVIMPIKGQGLSDVLKRNFRSVINAGLGKYYITYDEEKIDAIFTSKAQKLCAENPNQDVSQACTLELVNELGSELVAETRIDKEAGDYFISIQIKNVITGRITESFDNTCRDCSSAQLKDALSDTVRRDEGNNSPAVHIAQDSTTGLNSSVDSNLSSATITLADTSGRSATSDEPDQAVNPKLSQSIPKNDRTALFAEKHTYRKLPDGSILQEGTGLIWQAFDRPNMRAYKDALAYCEDLNAHGKTDWKLPDRYELASLVDYDLSEPAAAPILNMRSGRYWSSSVRPSESNQAWYVSFSHGFMGWRNQTDGDYVRCVRSGK